MQWEGNAGSARLQEAEARGNATLEQVAAEFNPLRPPALRGGRGGDRVHADLNQHRFGHNLDRVVRSSILLTSVFNRNWTSSCPLSSEAYAELRSAGQPMAAAPTRG